MNYEEQFERYDSTVMACLARWPAGRMAGQSDGWLETGIITSWYDFQLVRCPAGQIVG